MTPCSLLEITDLFNQIRIIHTLDVFFVFGFLSGRYLTDLLAQKIS